MRPAWLLGLLVTAAACDCGGGDGLRALAPAIVVAPSPIDFGTVYLGRTVVKTLSVQNAGDAVLSVSSVRMKEGSHAGLSVADAQLTIASGAEAGIAVRLDASALGPLSGAVLIASDDPARPVVEVPIAGVVERRPGPAIEVCVESADIPLAKSCADPLRIDFGAIPFGMEKRARITLRSAGTAPLQVLSTAARTGAHPSIVLDPSDMTTTLAVDAEASIEVTVSPVTDVEVSAVVQIESDDEERDLVPVIITASGVAPALCPSEAAIDFGTVRVGELADRTVTLESCGVVPIELSALAIAGGNPEFSVRNAPSLPIVLMPGERRDVELRYAPVDAGQDRERLRIGSSLPDGFIELSGRSASCDLSAAPMHIDFGAVANGQSRRRVVLVENLGAADCTVSSAVLTATASRELALVSPPAVPITVAPGSSFTVDVEYTPADATDDRGRLEVTSDDPSEPTLVVTLEGRRLGAGQCSLSVMPDPINFGLVPVGTQRTLGVQITNNGGTLCTVLQVSLAMGSSREFQVMQLATPMVIRSGQSRNIDVIFEPRDTGTKRGTLQLFGLNPLQPSLTVPISGTGSGPRLCVDPDPVVFGTHPIGATIQRQVSLIACGSEAINVSALALPAPTSAEFTLPAPPALPLAIPPGGRVSLDVAYRGADAGRDEGILRITSNDAIAADRDARLVGASSNSPCGDVIGRICGLDGAGPVSGATVYIDTPGQRHQATTDGRGDFALTCVPPGTWTVHAESGQWSTSFPVQVNAYSTTSVPGQHCLEPNSARVAVVWGEWDSIQGILANLRIPFTLYGDMGGQSESSLLLDPTELARYDIIFLNCGFNEGLVLSGAGLQNLRDFVANGGSLYASDWAYDVIEIGWPSFIDFYEDDSIPNDAQDAGNFSDWVDVVDASLRMQLGNRNRVQITSCCTGVDSAGPQSTVYLEGDRLRNGGRHPFMVSFQPAPTSGRVFYTDFHNTGQPDILDVFRWLITRL